MITFSATSDGRPASRGRIRWLLVDTFVLTRRNVITYLRSPEEIMSATIQPILFVLLFRYVFGGAINTDGATYVNYLMAGIFVQTATFLSMATGNGLARDIQTGLMDRFRSLPMSSPAVLAGRALATLLRSLVVIVVMVAVGVAVGFRPQGSPLLLLAAAGVLLLFVFALSWLGLLLGLLLRNPEAVQMMSMSLVFPLTFLSSAFVPTRTMPVWLRVFADHQPMTYVMDAVRSLVLGVSIGPHGWSAVSWAVGISIATVLVFAPPAVSRYRHMAIS